MLQKKNSTILLTVWSDICVQTLKISIFTYLISMNYYYNNSINKVLFFLILKYLPII